MNCTQLVYNSSADLISFCYKGCDYKVNDCFCYCLDDKILYNISYNSYNNLLMTCLFVCFILCGSITAFCSFKYKHPELQQPTQISSQLTSSDENNHATINVYEIYNQLPKYEEVIRETSVPLLQENTKENNNKENVKDNNKENN